MNKCYKITFKPVEPYFFGNEKSFAFPGQVQKSAYSSSYFIKSERTPSQSTILGALRYLFLPCKKSDYSYDPDEKEANERAVGKSSFDADYVPLKSTDKEIQDFGIIKKISPVFICGQNEFGENVTLIPTPMDHNRKAENSERNHKKSEKNQEEPDRKILLYTPFESYIDVPTTESTKLYACDFDVKKGIEHSWLSLEKGELYTNNDLFENDLRIGINRAEKKDGFFKKEYSMLKKGFSFAVYVELDTDSITSDKCVYLGQGKSAFAVSFTEEENTVSVRAQSFIGKTEYTRAGKPFIYCLSDCFIKDFDNENVLFCALDTKDYRAFKTIEKGKVEKGGVLYRLLKAGSIIITENPDEWLSKNMNSNAHNIGFNNYIIVGGQK